MCETGSANLGDRCLFYGVFGEEAFRLAPPLF
nr:MAG TPA: hypothetical protein [Caudoviricetes sp.]